MWVWGSFLVFILARSLGANASYFETLAVVGYALIPLVVAALADPVLARVRGILSF